MAKEVRRIQQDGRCPVLPSTFQTVANSAILGAPPDVYDAYTEGVQREFAKVPAAMFRAGRLSFVTTQLARASLFHTRFFRERYGQQARAKLERELAALTPT